MSVNGTLVKAKIYTLTLEYTHLSVPFTLSANAQLALTHTKQLTVQGVT